QVREAAGNRRHADVAAAPYGHLAERRQAANLGEVPADRPSARTTRMAREAKPEGDRRSAAVGRNRHARSERMRRAAAATEDYAANTRRIDDRGPYSGGRVEFGAGRDRGQKE